MSYFVICGNQVKEIRGKKKLLDYITRELYSPEDFVGDGYEDDIQVRASTWQEKYDFVDREIDDCDEENACCVKPLSTLLVDTDVLIIKGDIIGVRLAGAVLTEGNVWHKVYGEWETFEGKDSINLYKVEER